MKKSRSPYLESTSESLFPLGESAKVRRVESSNVLIEKYGTRKWILSGEPEQDWWMELDSNFERLPGDWEYDREEERVTCRFLSFEDEEWIRRKEAERKERMQDLTELIEMIDSNRFGECVGSEVVKVHLVESTDIVVEEDGLRKWYPIHRVKDDAWIGFGQDGEDIRGCWSYNEAESTMHGRFYSKEVSSE